MGGRMNRLLTPAQVAERLGVCVDTVYRRINAGDIPALRTTQFNKRAVLRIDERELERWLYNDASQPDA
jgi:excisionase family DNA binding protein